MLQHTTVAPNVEKLTFELNDRTILGSVRCLAQRDARMFFVVRHLPPLAVLENPPPPFLGSDDDMRGGRMRQQRQRGRNSLLRQIVTQTNPLFYQNGVVTKSLGFNTKPQKYLKTYRLLQLRIEYALLYVY